MRSKDREYIGFELSKDLLNKLKEEANKSELSISAFIRMILINYMKQKEDERSNF